MAQQSKLFIKGMVCNRCIMIVKKIFQDLGYPPLEVALGEVTLPGDGNSLDKVQLQNMLSAHGFGILEDHIIKIGNEIKALVQEVYSGDYDFPANFRFSHLVKTRWNKEYETVSNVFIAIERKTVEQYIIDFRINKVKELLVYSPFTLADIAYKLNFTSVSHLSAQFKQQTGLTPSFFREIGKQKRGVISLADQG